jgi:predicted 3-demethylubiquinone-9 3-methyltransferase (glyoxalase superfamily)
MFQGGTAEEAMTFYLSLFADARINDLERYGANEAGTEGLIKKASFSVGGQTVLCFDSPVQHAFNFTPSFSFFVDCESGEELDRLNASLAEGGTILMPLDNYGFSRQFVWLNDRFGVSWQINLP